MADNKNKNSISNIVIILLLIGLFARIWDLINKSRYHKQIKIALVIVFLALLIYSNISK